jgi:hypothetical protein
MRKEIRILLASFIITCGSASLAHGDSDSVRAGWTLKTRAEAVDAALRLTGFSGLRKVSVDSSETKLVVVANDQTPFLHKQINGRQFWRVEVDVNLELLVENRVGDTARQFDPISRRFSIYLDPQTGNIIKLSSELEQDYPHKPVLPPPYVAEWVLKSTKEIFHGFPTEPPGVFFLEALRYVIGHPFAAKEIHALYVVHSSMNRKEPRPVWSIDLRGFDGPVVMPSHLAADADIPLEQQNHMRSIVCAKYGRHLGSTTSPQSVPLEIYRRTMGDSSEIKPE